MGENVQYCAIEICSENEIPFHFPQLFHTNYPIFVKQFSLIIIFSIYDPEAREIEFPSWSGNSVAPLVKHNSLLFPWISPPISPDFPMIPTDSF